MSTNTHFKVLAKIGYAARGTVFILVAGLALFSGVASAKPDTRSALAALLKQPFGRLWVALIGLGFLGWRMAQSVCDSDGHGKSAKAITIRLTLFGSAVTYVGLAAYALAHAISAGAGDEASGENGLAQWIMSQPLVARHGSSNGRRFFGHDTASLVEMI